MINNARNEVRNEEGCGVPILLVVVVLLAVAVIAEAQQPKKTPRIGFLSGGFPGATFGIRSVQRELAALGYVEGKNIAFEYRYAEDKPERSPALADDLVRRKVDVIVAGGGNDTQAAKNATKMIPIVFLESVSDPVAVGLVDSLARPGGNITGFTTIATVLAGKRLELLKEAIPALTRRGVVGIRKRGKCAAMEREPTSGATTGSATLFHGGK